jgi:PRTRC genetic system protein B
MTDFSSEYKPVQAIIVHHNEKERDYYLETRKIEDDGSFGAGKPLLMNTLKEIFQSISISAADRLQFKGMIPKNVLLVRNDPGDSIVCWISKPQKVKLNFTEKVGLKTGLFSVPAMLWLVKNNQLSVFALKKTSFTKTTKLYRIPFPNVGDSGSVCWGSGQWPQETKYYERFMKEMMIGFWESKFSHVMRKEMLDIWGPLRNKEVPFPTDKLTQSSQNREIKRLLGL